jgi:hypothetical protein
MTLQKNLERFRGDSYPILLKVKDEENTVNITSYTFRFTMAKDIYTLRNPLVRVGGTIQDGSTGIVEFKFLPNTFNVVGDYIYDIQMTCPAGVVYTVMAGTISIKQDVSI